MLFIDLGIRSNRVGRSVQQPLARLQETGHFTKLKFYHFISNKKFAFTVNWFYQFVYLASCLAYYMPHLALLWGLLARVGALHLLHLQHNPSRHSVLFSILLLCCSAVVVYHFGERRKKALSPFTTSTSNALSGPKGLPGCVSRFHTLRTTTPPVGTFPLGLQCRTTSAELHTSA